MKMKDLFWGMIFVLAAVLVIVNRLGFFTEFSVLEIVVTVALAAIILKSIRKINFWGILFPVALLCCIYADAWGIMALTPGPVLLTALLGSIGLSMIFKKHKWWNHSPYHREESFSQVIDQPDGNIINCSASFGSSMKYINTPNFEKANIKCSFGAMKVYFDNAIISSGRAEINLDVSFSGVELYIPKSWNIVHEVNTSLGSVEEKNRRTDSVSPVVTITGNISFGGVEIIYV